MEVSPSPAYENTSPRSNATVKQARCSTTPTQTVIGVLKGISERVASDRRWRRVRGNSHGIRVAPVPAFAAVPITGPPTYPFHLDSFRRLMQTRLARTTLAFVACTFLGV